MKNEKNEKNEKEKEKEKINKGRRGFGFGGVVTLPPKLVTSLGFGFAPSPPLPPLSPPPLSGVLFFSFFFFVISQKNLGVSVWGRGGVYHPPQTQTHRRHPLGITSRAAKKRSSRCRDQGGHPQDTMWRLLGRFGLAKVEGRAKQALKMAGRLEDMATCTTVRESTGLRVPPVWALESQCASLSSLALPIMVCVFSHFVLVRTLMIETSKLQKLGL